jgi:hypothetical protein
MLSEGDMFARILPVIRGLAGVVITKHVIDLDADPFVLNGWTIEEHIESGQLEWSPNVVALYLSPNQQSGRVIKGKTLREELAGRVVFNANLLDFLLANPQLISEDWKDKTVFFWGTIYRDSGGNLYVRYLYWSNGSWRWRYRWLDHGWNDNDPAAVPAK